MFLAAPGTAKESALRALWKVHTTSQARSTILITNSGWQPIYTLEVEAREGDLLRLIGQTQLTVDLAPEVGQQLRLTVNGEQVGTQPIEINTQPGSHHLPMSVYGLVLAHEDGPMTITLEGSSFHSDAVFPVTIDQQENLAYGSLLAEQYRSYPDLGAAWSDGALLLQDIYKPQPLRQEIWCLQPYVQETLSSLVVTASQGDVLRLTGQAVASGTLGLEQFTGVLAADGRAVSPYGGQNVDPLNPLAPMILEGLERVAEDGQFLFEHRIYGAFQHGLTLVEGSPRLEVAHFGAYGRQLARFGQEHLQVDTLTADGEWVELCHQEIDLEQGDILTLMGNLQFAPPDFSGQATIDCQLLLQIDGPEGAVATAMTQKSLTPVKSVLPLLSALSAQADEAGRYRISVKSSGRSLQGPIPLRLDSQASQLQYLLFSRP